MKVQSVSQVWCRKSHTVSCQNWCQLEFWQQCTNAENLKNPWYFYQILISWLPVICNHRQLLVNFKCYIAPKNNFYIHLILPKSLKNGFAFLMMQVAWKTFFFRLKHHQLNTFICMLRFKPGNVTRKYLISRECEAMTTRSAKFVYFYLM